MKRWIAALLAGILLFSLSACDGSNQVEEEITPYPVTVGNVTVTKKPRAVASLSPTLTNILLDLGYQDKIVGYSDEDEIPNGVVLSDLTELIAAAEEAASSAAEADLESTASNEEPTSALPDNGVSTDEVSAAEDAGDVSSAESSDPLMTSSLAAFLETWDGKSPIPKEPVYYSTIGTAMNPDMTKIGIVKPEILFTTLPLTKAQMDKLDEVNIKVIVMPAAKNMEELGEQYISIIKAMEGRLEADSTGQAIAADMEAKLSYIVSQVPKTKKSFLYVRTLDPLIATGDTWESELLSLLAVNLAEGGTAYTVTEEELAGMDPDVIFYSDPLEPVHFAENERFMEKSAVTGENLIKLDAEKLMTQTRDIVETMREIASQLYPNVDFTEPEPVSDIESDGLGEGETEAETSGNTAS